MNVTQLYKECQENAPSFLRIKGDGAPIRCSNCRVTDFEPMLKIFTPSGVSHFAIHKECVDEEWLAKAKDMGEI